MVVVVYESQGGSSKRYAEMLAERIDCICIPRTELKDDSDEGILYVGWRSGPFVVGLKDIACRKNIIAVICVGLEPYDERSFNTIKMKNGIGNLFYIRGAMDRSKLTFGQKLLLGIVSIKMLLFNRSPEDKETRRIMDRGGDLSSPEQLDDVIEWFSRK